LLFIFDSFKAQQSGYKCVQFYVKANKNNTATLNLNRKNKLTGDIKNLFSMSGKSDIDSWVFNEVQLPESNIENMNEAYSFLFEGITGSSQGQLAFDDVKLYDGKCLGQTVLPDKFDCGRGELIDYSKVCDFKIDCTTQADELNCGSCDFEDVNLCGWNNSNSGSFKWIRSRNSSNFPGPSIDHTFNTTSGQFI
jgi:hypothetical protein